MANSNKYIICFKLLFFIIIFLIQHTSGQVNLIRNGGVETHDFGKSPPYNLHKNNNPFYYFNTNFSELNIPKVNIGVVGSYTYTGRISRNISINCVFRYINHAVLLGGVFSPRINLYLDPGPISSKIALTGFQGGYEYALPNPNSRKLFDAFLFYRFIYHRFNFSSYEIKDYGTSYYINSYTLENIIGTGLCFKLFERIYFMPSIGIGFINYKMNIDYEQGFNDIIINRNEFTILAEFSLYYNIAQLKFQSIKHER